MWDGLTEWEPPTGHRVEENHEGGIRDIWMEAIQDFVSPLSTLKLPESQESIDQREAAFQEAKADFKVNLVFVKPNGELEA